MEKSQKGNKMTVEEEKKIATDLYYRIVHKYIGFEQRPHDKDHVISTYVNSVISQRTDDMTTKEQRKIHDNAFIYMHYQVFKSMRLKDYKGKVVAEWDDRESCSGFGLVAGAIGLLLGISLF